MKKNLFAIMAGVAMAATIGLTSCGGGNSEPKIKVINYGLSSEQYAFAVNKNNTEMLNSVNTFLSEKSTEIDAIKAKYLVAGAPLDEFGDATIKTSSTDKANELVVATNLDFAPFEYVNGAKIAGIDMEIAQLFANYLNKTLVVVNMEFDAVCTAVQTQPEQYDIAMAGLSINPEREEAVNFSNYYYDSTQVLITKVDDTTFDSCASSADVEAKLASLENVKAGGQNGTTSMLYINGDEAFGFDGYDNIEFAGYDSAALAVTDMLNGNINFVVVDQATATALASSFNK